MHKFSKVVGYKINLHSNNGLSGRDIKKTILLPLHQKENT